MQLLDVIVCNSANKPSFQNATKSHFTQCSIDGKNAATFFPSKERWQKGHFLDFEKMVYYLNYRSKCPEDADFGYFCLISIR